MIKIIKILIGCMLIAGSVGASYLGPVTNTATRDTLPIPFVPLDTLGNPCDLASGDSVYVAVLSPGGTVVFKDSMAYNDASIVYPSWEDYAGPKMYNYVERVSVLDGSSTAKGIFTVHISVQDLTSAALTTRNTHTFQMINDEFENYLAELDNLDKIDSLESALADANMRDKIWDADTTGHAQDGTIGKWQDPSEFAQDMADVWRNQDTLNIDSSDIGVWLVNNLSSMWNSTQRDSILAALTDANIDDKVWTDPSTRILTALDEDNTTIDIDGTTIGTVTTVTNDVGIDAGSVDDIWDEDSTDHYTSPHMGFLASQTGAAGSITDADKGDIADSVWNIRWIHEFQAGSMGDSLSTAAYVQGSGGAATWNSTQRDSVLSALSDTRIGLKTWTYTGARTLSAFGFDVSLAAGEYTQIADTVVPSVSTYDPATDSVLVDVSAAMASGNLAGSIADQVVDSMLIDKAEFKSTGFSTHSATDVWNLSWATAWTAGSMGDSLNNTSLGTLLANQQKQTDSLNATLDSIQNQDNWGAKEVTVQEALDTLQKQDDWVSTHTPADVYSEFISGTNENVFKADVSGLSTLTEDSNIGIDLDDVTGTLDNSEVGDNFITAQKLGTSCINADEIGVTAISELNDSLYTLNKVAMAWAGFGVGNGSHTDYGTTIDTIIVTMQDDSIGYILIIHEPHGESENPPDSTRNVAIEE